jgi:hypothetical protein
MRDANSAVRAGRLALEAAEVVDPGTGEIPVPAEPWLRPVGDALTTGTLSVACAEAIGNGLGKPSAEISSDMLTLGAARLVVDAIGTPALAATADTPATPAIPPLDADRLYRRAREVRNEIDAAGVADREEAHRQARGLKFRQLPDGMSRLTWDLDPESAAVVRDLYDRATSPRRGGPRFVSGEHADTAERISTDDRTTEQLASDTFLHLLEAGADADSSQLLGSGGAVVSVLIPAAALATRTGAGFVAGQTEPVSIATVERLLCGGTSTPIIFDEHGHPLDLGREQRLFTKKQGIALAARDGGCMVWNCNRPASWTEAHHIQHYQRDHGGTNIADGVLLCKHHHLMFHNNGWEIRRRGNEYWAIPPASVDRQQNPIRMQSKSPAYLDMLKRTG